MSAKVTIPNDVADAIESFRKDGQTNANIIRHVLGDGPIITGRLSVLKRKIPFDTLMAALINDYDREQTAEERAHKEIRERYAYWHRSGIGLRHDRAADGIIFTLGTLGVKITGVNA